MLAMGLSAHAMESMTLNDALEALAFRSTYDFYFFAFGKDVYGENITKILFYGKIAEFFYKLFGRSVGLGEVIFFCVGRVLFFLVAKCQLEGSVAIGVLCLDLRHRAGTRLDDRTSGLLAVRTEYARHPDLFTNNTFHFFKVYAFGYEDNKRHPVDAPGGKPGYTVAVFLFNPSFAADLFFSSPFFRLVRVRGHRSTGSKQTLNGLFICSPDRARRQWSGSLLVSSFVPSAFSLRHCADPALLYPGEFARRK